jgi:hypothetical protein
MFCWCGIQLYEPSCSNLGALMCPRHDRCICGNSDVCGLGNICTYYKSQESTNIPIFLVSEPDELIPESENDEYDPEPLESSDEDPFGEVRSRY